MPLRDEEDSSEEESSEEESSEEMWEDSHDPPPVRSLMLCFMFLFQGYGAMVGAPQHALKEIMQISSEDSAKFQDATASFQMAKLLMRVAQIAFLVFVRPNGIVHLAYALMFIALLVPLVLVWGMGLQDLWVVYLQYCLGGIAVGLFEGTFLSVISSLGKNTKTFAIMGAPLGFAMLNIVLGTFSHFGMPVIVYYIYPLLCLPIAAAIFYVNAPKAEAKKDGKGCEAVMNSIMHWDQWVIKMMPWLVAKFIGNFVLEDGFPLFFNTYSPPKVPLGHADDESNTVPFDLYLAWFWFPCMALGDTISRRLPQFIPLTSWKICAVCLAVAIFMCIGGEALDFLMIGVVNGLAVFISNFGNGFIYGLSAKFIDSHIPEEHRYTAYNLWCFIGDCGGYAGQGSLSVKLANAVCGGRHFHYVCVSHHAAPTAQATTTAAMLTSTAATAATQAAAPTIPPLPDVVQPPALPTIHPVSAATLEPTPAAPTAISLPTVAALPTVPLVGTSPLLPKNPFV